MPSKTNITCDNLDSTAIYTHIEKIDAGLLGKTPTNPPIINTAGITLGMQYTVNTDKSNIIYKVPGNYYSGDATAWFNWTKSAVGADESTKEVKWQVKYLKIAPGDNCNSGETTLSVQDTYDDADLISQIIYSTATIIIPAASLVANSGLALEISAITPSGVALSDEPLLLSMVFQCTCVKIL